MADLSFDDLIPQGGQQQQPAQQSTGNISFDDLVPQSRQDLPEGARRLRPSMDKIISAVPHSAAEFGKNLIQPFIHPIDTANDLNALGGGIMQHLGIMKGEQYKPAADAVGKFFMDRYGSVEGVKKTLEEDPVGALADLSTVLSGGGGLAARAPGLAGRAGEAVGAVGRMSDPLNAVTGTAGAVGRGVGRAAAETIGTTTHVGADPLLEAAKAGYEGGSRAKSFRENIGGVAPTEEGVADAQRAVEGLRAKAQAALVEGKGKMKAGEIDRPLEFDRIDKALADATKVKTYHGVPIDESTRGVRQQIGGIVDFWKKLPPEIYHTPIGLDYLKQKLWNDVKVATDDRAGFKIRSQAYNAVKDTIVKEYPQYAKVMKGYEEAQKQINALNKELSLPTPKGGNIDTALRKMQQALRNNVNTSFGRRKQMAQFLADNGAPDLMAKLAGQSLHPWAPRGLGKLAASVGLELGALLGLSYISPAAIPLAASMSPRLMGEAAYWGGKAARPLKYIPEGLGLPAYQAGRVHDLAGFKKGGRVTRTIRLPRYADGGAAPPASQTLGDLFDPQSLMTVAGGPENMPTILGTEATPQNINYASMQGAKYLPMGRDQAIGGGMPQGAGTEGTNPNDWFMTRSDIQSPLEYTEQGGGGSSWAPNDKGGYFTLDQLYRGGPMPQPMMFRSNAPSTNNWRLTVPFGGGPGDIMRNGMVIRPGDAAYHGQRSGAAGGDMGNSGEQTVHVRQRFAPFSGAGTRGSLFWPGGPEWGNWYGERRYENRGGRIKAKQYADGGEVPLAPPPPSGDNPYTGKTLGDLFEYTSPTAEDPYGGVTWDSRQAATPEWVNASTQMGFRLKTPAEGSPLESSGPEGGYFTGDPQFSGGINPVGYYGQNWGKGTPPPSGIENPSTNNWRLLPGGYNKPGYAMRAGHVINIDAARQGAPYGMVDSYKGTLPMYPVYSGKNYGAGLPAARAGYGFFPGQVEIDTMSNFFGNLGSATKRGGRIKAKQYADGGDVTASQFAGKTLGDIMDSNWTGGVRPLVEGSDVPTGSPGLSLEDQLATNRSMPVTPENLSWAMGAGQLKPEAQQQLSSGGSEGGWFPSSPQFQGGPEGEEPNAIALTRSQMGNSGWAGPPQGMQDANTNNWRLLPPGYNNPNYFMRRGEIIDRRIFSNPAMWGPWAGMPIGGELHRVGGAYPVNVAGSYAGHGGNISGGWPGSTLGMHRKITEWVKRGGRIKGLPKVAR